MVLSLLTTLLMLAARNGTVVDQTRERSYLDAGSDEGLKVGQVIQLYRRQKPATTCTVLELSAHRAVCKGADARPGDTFPLAATAAAKDAAGRTRPQAAAPMPAASATAAAFQATPVAMVDFHGQRGGSSRIIAAEVSLGHTSNFRNGSSGYHQERLEIDLRSARLGFLGARASARATLLAWSGRPFDERFRTDARFQLYVWEAEIATREVGRRYAIGLGRIWPYHLPGLAMLDGAQAGYRSAEGDVEVGAYGGLRPDPLTTVPGINRWSAGAYYALAHRSGGRLFRHEARVGVRNVLNVGPQLEAEGLLQADVTRWLGFGVAARGALDGFSRPAFDNARAHVTLRGGTTLRATAAFRYINRIGDDLDPSTVSTVLGDGARLYGTADVDYRPAPWVQLGVNAFASGAILERTQRYGVQPQLGFPTLFGRHGGITLAHREELGWLAGRTSSLSALILPSHGIRVMARASYNATASPNDPFLLLHEVALLGFVDAAIWQMLSVRATLVGRMEVPVPHLNGVAQVDVVGVF